MTNKKYREFEIIAAKARKFKEQNGLTYDDIGRALGCTRSHVHRIFTLQTYPSFPVLVELAKFMGLSVSELFAENSTEDHPDNEKRMHRIALLLEEMILDEKQVNSALEYIRNLLN